MAEGIYVIHKDRDQIQNKTVLPRNDYFWINVNITHVTGKAKPFFEWSARPALFDYIILNYDNDINIHKAR